MRKTAAALVESKVKEERIKNLLVKYWDLRPSDAAMVISDAKEKYKIDGITK